MRRACLILMLLAVSNSAADARVVRLEIRTRATVLDGISFGLAGAFESLSGTVHFALDPEAPANRDIVDLSLAPANAAGEVEFSADFYLLKPLDPSRSNGVLFYEAGNRGRKRILSTFQKARAAAEPRAREEFGDGSLMAQGFSLLWMGWQWDVPEGRMRMEMPIAGDAAAPIQGLVRGNFIGEASSRAAVADRRHRAYSHLPDFAAEAVMTVRDLPLDEPETVARERWRFVEPGIVELDSGFSPGKIYDVVYRSERPKVVGAGLSGTRDLVSFFKHDASERNPLSGIRFAIGWGVSQTGRFLRHFVYQGFNADEDDRIVFDGIIDQVGGAGRGSFNHRFGQASRDALQHYNILFPVDMFPFADTLQTDPETGETDGLLRRASETGTVPKMFHILTNSEYFNRAGSLVHTDPAGERDALIPDSSRIYTIASAPHIVGRFPPQPNSNASFLGQAAMNPLRYDSVIRALFYGMVSWVTADQAPPASVYPTLTEATLAHPAEAGWPQVPGVALPQAPLTAYRLDFGPEWDKGIVSITPPKVGKPFVVLVPVVDENGNDRAGIRLPEIEVPLATHTGWNYRHPDIGAPERLSSEIGSYFPFAATREERLATGDPRASISERYASKDAYLGRITTAALRLVRSRYLLVQDVPDIVESAERHYDWATNP